MEGRKEAFRMYLEQSGTTTALTQFFITLYELKDKRPQTTGEALTFVRENLSNNFPSQADYNELLKEVEESRKKVAAIREAEELAKEKAEEERHRKADEKKKTTKQNTAHNNVISGTITSAEVTTFDEDVARFKELKSIKDCTSLLVKHLSEDIFKKLKDVTTSGKKTLLDCIKAGLENPKLPVGIYAADKEAYKTFNNIFDPILQEYYGVEPDFTINVDDLKPNWGDPTSESELSDLLNANAVSTRITYAVSIKDFDLIPAMKNDEFTKLKESVCIALPYPSYSKYDFPIADDIKTDMEKQQLFFEPAKRQLNAGDTIDVTIDCAILQSPGKDLTIWINEEEHLKFISTGEKGEIKTTFLRLKEAVAAVKGAQLDNLTFCPTNLGPSIHAMVVVKLPKLSAERGDVKEIAEELALKICVKQTTVTGVFEISNKPQWNMSQFDAIKEFGTEVNTLLEKEKNLITTIDEAKTRWEVLNSDDTRSDKSLLVTHLNEDIFNNLSDETNKRAFLECIRPGLENPDLPVGIYASDKEAYKTFADTFKLIIAEYHGIDVDKDKYASDWTLDSTKCENLNANDQLVKSTRITCSRTLEDFPLNPAMNETHFTEVMEKVKTVLIKLPGDFEGKFYELETMDATTKKELAGKKQLFGLDNKLLRDIRATKFWPKGRGVFVCNTDKLVIWVNEEDHLKFISTDDGYDIEKTFNRLKDAVAAVELNLKFEQHDSWGYITSCPTKLGSTINASVIMELKKVAAELRNTPDLIEEMINSQSLEIDVKQLSHKDQFEISNKQRLNETECDAVIHMQAGAVALKLEEEKL